MFSKCARVHRKAKSILSLNESSITRKSKTGRPVSIIAVLVVRKLYLTGQAQRHHFSSIFHIYKLQVAGFSDEELIAMIGEVQSCDSSFLPE